MSALVLFKAAKYAVLGLMLLTIIGQTLMSWYRADALRISLQRSIDLEKEIVDMLSAQALTETLQEYNAELTQDQVDMNQEIMDAPSYSDPLPDDIMRALARLRAANPESASGSP